MVFLLPLFRRSCEIWSFPEFVFVAWMGVRGGGAVAPVTERTKSRERALASPLFPVVAAYLLRARLPLLSLSLAFSERFPRWVLRVE